MFPFGIIKRLRPHENLSHSAIHLSIAEPIEGFNFGVHTTTGTAYTSTECNQSCLRRREQRRYFCNENISALSSWWRKHPKSGIVTLKCSKHPKSGVVTLRCSTFPNVFHLFIGKSALADVHKCTRRYSSGGFQSILCQVFREFVNCYASNENKTVWPKRYIFLNFIK